MAHQGRRRNGAQNNRGPPPSGGNYRHAPPPPGYGAQPTYSSSRNDGYYDNHNHPYNYFRPRSRSPPRFDDRYSRGAAPQYREAPAPRMSDMYDFGGESRDYSRQDYREELYRPRDNQRYGGQQARPGSDVYRFGDEQHRGQSNGNNNHGAFTFRADQQADFRAPPSIQTQGSGRGGRRGYEGRQGQGRRNQPRPKRRTLPANARDILHANMDREVTPERLEGMLEGISRFKDIDALDQESDEDNDDSINAHVSKRVKTETMPAENDADSKPKWSNPDPYFICPPIDELRDKRKDVVHLLRKAKVEPNGSSTTTSNAVTQNIDFIGFGDDEDEEVLKNSDSDEEGQISSGDDGGDDPNIKLNLDVEEQDSFSDLRGVPPSGIIEKFSKAAASLPPKPVFAAPTSNGSLAGRIALPSKPSKSAVSDGGNPFQETFDMPLEEALAALGEVADDAPQRSKALKKGKKRRAAEGEIIPAYIAKDRASSSPWYIDRSANRADGHADARSLFNLEVADFYSFIKPRPFEEKVRRGVIDRLQANVGRLFRNAIIKPFGSYSQGVYLPTSDLDLVLLSYNFQTGRYSDLNKRSYWRLRDHLVRTKFAEAESIQVIAAAKVPIIKFIDRVTGLKCDLSFDNDSGLKAVSTFTTWMAQWPFLPAVLSILKQFLLMRDMNEVFTGGLGGLSITCMLVSMLQQDAQFRHIDVTNVDYAAMLLSFFKLYGKDFDMSTKAISVVPPQLYPKYNLPKCKPNRWTIFDPNNADNDISGGSIQAPLIKATFADAHKLLADLLVELGTAGPELLRDQSFLRTIIGGNYERMAVQRAMLQDVHERVYGPVPTKSLILQEQMIIRGAAATTTTSAAAMVSTPAKQSVKEKPATASVSKSAKAKPAGSKPAKPKSKPKPKPASQKSAKGNKPLKGKQNGSKKKKRRSA